jgi:hypothetical protein
MLFVASHNVVGTAALLICPSIPTRQRYTNGGEDTAGKEPLAPKGLNAMRSFRLWRFVALHYGVGTANPAINTESSIPNAGEWGLATAAKCDDLWLPTAAKAIYFKLLPVK